MESGGPLCDDGRMEDLVAAAQSDPQAGVLAIDRELERAPGDPRLHFLRGSLLIGLSRFIEAHDALERAVAIAPDFAIARFQLGFFELTSGEAAAAMATWAPLKRLPADHWLRHFVDGLECLIADRFDACVAALRAGIAANAENEPLNRDMELIIARCAELRAAPTPDAPSFSEEVSATSLLLGGGKR